mmetsp:Transcript_12420/g.35300  ORF Transcript_12420/g.35300 Transcript_12420/m.35300 type:complete len:252 (-) Transcript_12420:763-1518(-)
MPVCSPAWHASSGRVILNELSPVASALSELNSMGLCILSCTLPAEAACSSSNVTARCLASGTGTLSDSSTAASVAAKHVSPASSQGVEVPDPAKVALAEADSTLPDAAATSVPGTAMPVGSPASTSAEAGCSSSGALASAGAKRSPSMAAANGSASRQAALADPVAIVSARARGPASSCAELASASWAPSPGMRRRRTSQWGVSWSVLSMSASHHGPASLHMHPPSKPSHRHVPPKKAGRFSGATNSSKRV